MSVLQDSATFECQITALQNLYDMGNSLELAGGAGDGAVDRHEVVVVGGVGRQAINNHCTANVKLICVIRTITDKRPVCLFRARIRRIAVA